jgi:hypothetical protein
MDSASFYIGKYLKKFTCRSQIYTQNILFLEPFCFMRFSKKKPVYKPAPLISLIRPAIARRI